MADNNPSIPGGNKPAPQPKKETVRINLPPKPSAAPTIKLPTLPPGGPSAAGAPPPTGTHAPAPPMRTAAAPTAAPSGAPAAAPRPAAPRPAPAAPTVSGLDKGLAIAACVAALLALGTTIYCMTLFTPGQ